MTPELTPDQLLSTTRAVRKRLDLARPVERELLEECLALAFQAPTGGNLQGWHFVLVTEPGRKEALAELYRKSKSENEREAATVLGIPYEQVMQVALIPVAHTIGTDFKPGPRVPADQRVHWDHW